MILLCSKRAKLNIMMVSILLLCVLALSCGPKDITSTSETKGLPNIIIVPTSLDTTTKEIWVYGSDFTPNTIIDINLVGTWDVIKGEKAVVTLENPQIEVARSNEIGSFARDIILSRNMPLQAFGMEPGSVCALKATERDGVKSTTDLFVVVEEKK